MCLGIKMLYQNELLYNILIAMLKFLDLSAFGTNLF
jgi:hypothetical protein